MTDDIFKAMQESFNRSWKLLEVAKQELQRQHKILGSMKEYQRRSNESTQIMNTEVINYNPYNDPRD